MFKIKYYVLYTIFEDKLNPANLVIKVLHASKFDIIHANYNRLNRTNRGRVVHMLKTSMK